MKYVITYAIKYRVFFPFSIVVAIIAHIISKLYETMYLQIFGYLGNKAMTQSYNNLLKHPLVNVSKELTPPEPVHPVHDELCQREIKVKGKTTNLLFQIFMVTLTIFRCITAVLWQRTVKKVTHYKIFKVCFWKALIILNYRKSNFKQRYLCLYYCLLKFLVVT